MHDLAHLRAVSYARNSSARQKSIADQLKENRADADDIGVELVAELSDPVSASPHSTATCKNWATILDMVPTIDVILLWELSRGDRTNDSWVAFLSLCKEHGTVIRVTGHRRTYDPRKWRDHKALLEAGIEAQDESERTSERTTRGFAAQAANAKPTGRTTYGYQRLYHERTRKLVRQEPHPEHAAIVREIVQRIGRGHDVSAVARDLSRRGVPTPDSGGIWHTRDVKYVAATGMYPGARVFDPNASRTRPRRDRDGNIVNDDPARGAVVQRPPRPGDPSVVAEIKDRVASGERVSEIAGDLNDRGIAAPFPIVAWSAAAVSSIAGNPAYIGVRVHRPRGRSQKYTKRLPAQRYEADPEEWPALVTEADHYAAVRVLSSPERRQHLGPRPGRAVTLLGNLAECCGCGEKVRSRYIKGRRLYVASHVTVDADELDELVSNAIIGKLSDDDFTTSVRARSADDDRAAVDARAKVDELEARRRRWLQSASDGVTDPEDLAEILAVLRPQIVAARRRADQVSIPPVVRPFLDLTDGVRTGWADSPLGAKRELIRALIRITVMPVRSRTPRPIEDRVSITWDSASVRHSQD